MAVTPRFKRNIALTGAALFVLHFVVVVLYVLPHSWFPEPVNTATYHYMVPMFHQNWSIFAPEPPLTNDRLYYRVQDESGTWSAWIDPGAELREKHETYRLTYHWKLYNIYETLGRNLHTTWWRKYQQIDEQYKRSEERATQEALEASRDTRSHQLAVDYALAHAASDAITAVQLKYERTFVPAPDAADPAKVETLLFPPCDLATCHSGQP